MEVVEGYNAGVFLINFPFMFKCCTSSPGEGKSLTWSAHNDLHNRSNDSKNFVRKEIPQAPHANLINIGLATLRCLARRKVAYVQQEGCRLDL